MEQPFLEQSMVYSFQLCDFTIQFNLLSQTFMIIKKSSVQIPIKVENF